MAEETLETILYETRHHASGSCSPNYPPRQINDGGNKGLLSLLSTRGLTQLKDKWIGYGLPKKLKRWVSLFVSPKGERVAVAVGNHITILRKDDDYQQACGTFASGNVGSYTLGAWSESHDVLGLIDDMDTLYFIKSNGEEIIRIERKHLKVSLPIVGLLVPHDIEIKGSLLCNFNFVTSDGSLYHIEISQDLGASISSIRAWSDIKRKFPANFICLDYNLEHSLLVLVGSVASTSLTSSSGLCSLSVCHWNPSSDLRPVSSIQFKGFYSKPKGFTGHVVYPKVQISPCGKFIGTSDLSGCLNIFKLDDDYASLSLVACGESVSGKEMRNTFPIPAESSFLDDVVDFTWWTDHVCTVAKKGGALTMFDVISGKKLTENDPTLCMPVVERIDHLLGRLFVLDIPSLKERINSVDISEISCIHDVEQCVGGNITQFDISKLRWSLISLSERSVLEMYDVLINSQKYQSALNFADRYKLDKDQVYKSQWLHSEQGIDDVQMLLANIKDEAFLLGECVERVGQTEDAVRSVLQLGFNLTSRYKFSQPETDQCDHIWDVRLSRLQLLQFRDRLETFLGINMGRFSVQEYSKFRVMLINEVAVKLAENGKIGALNLLFKRHPFSLYPFILNVLAAIPETVPVQTYSQLLPGRSPPPATAFREKDWVECEEMVKYIRSLPENDERLMLVRTEPVIKQLLGVSWPSMSEILVWYMDRARDIDKLSGQLDNSLGLLEYGCRKGFHELQQFLDDVSYLQHLVYPEGDDKEVYCPLGLAEWEYLSDYEKFKTMLRAVKEDNVVETLRVRAIPFMQKKLNNNTSPLDKEHQRGESFLVRWLKEIAAENNIEICSVVIDDWCRDRQSGFFANEVEAIDCALHCIYLCSATDRWNTMASILSKLPSGRGGEICLGGLDKRLKLAEAHIEAGRLLALYQVPKPINFFLEAHTDDKGVKQILRLILSKFARRQPGRSDNDWASMWRDLQCLQEKAFPFLDLEYMLMEFCRGLLKAGRFSLARNYLRGTGTVSLAAEKAENLVIQTAREYLFSASSLSSSEIWKAKDCLDLFPSSINVRLEADVIDALTVKLPNLGVNLLPMQYKQIKDPIEIIKMAITSQPGAYLNVDEIIEVAKLLGLRSQEEISAVQEAIAREAAVAGDLQLAFDLCLILARKGHGLVWDLCAAIARGPAIENMDVSSRKKLLSFALCHCDNESIGDLLHAWKDIDMQGQLESLMVLTGTTPKFTVEGSSMISPPGNNDQSRFAVEFAEGQESHLNKIKDILSKVAKDLPLANGTSWDDFLREHTNVLSFANLQLPWLVELSHKLELGKKFYPISTSGKQCVPVRAQAVITILSWLARNGFAPRDDLISSLAKSIMEPPATEEEDVMGCSFLLNLTDAFHGVEVIEEELKRREDYQETCSIMNVGMTYSLLHNSGAECKDPLQRRDLLLRKFQEKISSDELDKVDKAHSTFWRGWKLKLEEQKRAADHTKMLEELIPGVDAERFLSEDLHYMTDVVMSFIESVKYRKNPILRDLLKLADTYGLNRKEVLLKFLSCVLVSDDWSNEEIAAEISEFEREILDYALETIRIITSDVCAVIDGCNKARLAYIFALLSHCYFHLDTRTELPPSATQDAADSTPKLGHVYKVLEQECLRISFIKDLNFKNIADIHTGSLNFGHFNDEVIKHVNEFSVEALAEMVQALCITCTGTIPDDLISWQDVYRHHVQTVLENLESRARKSHLQDPESLQSLLSELEQTYDVCRKHIRILEHQSALVVMKQYFTGVIPWHVFGVTIHHDRTWKDCLIVLLNFWMRLIDDMLEIADSSEEKFSAASLMVCLKVFLKQFMEDKVTLDQGWGTVCYYANHSQLTNPAAQDFYFCRAMVLSGCGFGSMETLFSEVISQCSIYQTAASDTRGGISCCRGICDFYLNILESILSSLVHDSGEQQSLRNFLSSLSRSEGDLEVLKRVRTAVWERMAKFSDDLQLPSNVRVYTLEVMQSILGNVKVSTVQDENTIPWEEWTCPGKNMKLTADGDGPNQSDASSRFKNTLVALKTTKLASSISANLEITADDLRTVDSAVSCFLKLCEAADMQSHIDALLGILREWESLFMLEKTEEGSAESSKELEMGVTWSDDWDEGWESFHDEEPVQEEKSESSRCIHPLHTCWMEILKKLIMLSRFSELVRLIDQSLERPAVILIDEDGAHNLSQMLIGSDCFMALKITLLLPYEAVHLECLDAVEEKLKQGGFPGNTDDKGFLVLILSSGIISTIMSKSSYGATFSYLCYLVGNFSREYQEAQLSRITQTSRDDKEAEGWHLTFRRILFPDFVSELVKADQQILAGFLVAKFMHTNPSLSLVNVTEAGLRRYLGKHLQELEAHNTSAEATNPEILQNTLSSLEVKLKSSIQSALTLLPSSL